MLTIYVWDCIELVFTFHTYIHTFNEVLHNRGSISNHKHIYVVTTFDKFIYLIMIYKTLEVKNLLEAIFS